MSGPGFTIRSPWTALAHDLACIPVAWFGAYWLRFNLGAIPLDLLHAAGLMLPAVMMTQAVAFWAFGLYRGVWRFASIPDLVRILKAVTVGVLCSLLVLFLSFRLVHMPRAIFPIYTILLLTMLCGSRFVYRWYKDKRAPLGKHLQRVLIVGAGNAGESLCRDLLRKDSQYMPVAFVDDARKHHGRDIHGIRVLGDCTSIPNVIQNQSVDLIMIALPSANAKDMRRIHAICESTNIPVHALPGINDLMSGRVTLASLRKISLEDLLGRDPIALDRALIHASLAQKRVLVSGGAGSIGSELCRQILQFAPKELVIVDNNEYHLFLLEQELLKTEPQTHIHFLLADVCDATAVHALFSKHRPEVVFHAAAFKHVPLLQHQVRAAIKNNVLGTNEMAHAACVHDVEKFILVSTDKAVNPTSLMGASKRAAELVCQRLNAKTQFITVRFGNVLGSRGSVVETFKKQLEAGGPLTVTHPDMTRFFMTTKEACQLILQAMSLGQGRELFVLDMGEPVKIRYMAEQMIRLAGKKLDEEISVTYTGLREGEKLYEELFHKKEHLMATDHAKILIAKHRQYETELLNHLFEQLDKAVRDNHLSNMHKYLHALVPEYSNSEFEPEAEHFETEIA